MYPKMQNIPDDIVFYICYFLDDKSKLSYLSTCRRFNYLKSHIKLDKTYSLRSVADLSFFPSVRNIKLEKTKFGIIERFFNRMMYGSYDIDHINRILKNSDHLSRVIFDENMDEPKYNLTISRIDLFVESNEKFNRDQLEILPKNITHLTIQRVFINNKIITLIDDCYPMTIFFVFKFRRNVLEFFECVKCVRIGDVQNSHENKKFDIKTSFGKEFLNKLSITIPNKIKSIKLRYRFTGNMYFKYIGGTYHCCNINIDPSKPIDGFGFPQTKFGSPHHKWYYSN